MSREHLIRKSILICQTSALADSLSDGEIMSAIRYVYDTLAGEECIITNACFSVKAGARKKVIRTSKVN